MNNIVYTLIGLLIGVGIVTTTDKVYEQTTVKKTLETIPGVFPMQPTGTDRLLAKCDDMNKVLAILRDMQRKQKR